MAQFVSLDLPFISPLLESMLKPKRKALADVIEQVIQGMVHSSHAINPSESKFTSSVITSGSGSITVKIRKKKKTKITPKKQTKQLQHTPGLFLI